MGALPRLKKKDELRYRKGSTNESQNCRYCQHIIDLDVTDDDGIVVATGKRCKIMGVKESRRYRVRADYTCDAQAFDEAKKNW